MINWFKKVFDMGNAEFEKEMAELHDPGHAEKNRPVKTSWQPVYTPPDYSFGTYVCEADKGIKKYDQ